MPVQSPEALSPCCTAPLTSFDCTQSPRAEASTTPLFMVRMMLRLIAEPVRLPRASTAVDVLKIPLASVAASPPTVSPVAESRTIPKGARVASGREPSIVFLAMTVEVLVPAAAIAWNRLRKRRLPSLTERPRASVRRTPIVLSMIELATTAVPVRSPVACRP